MILNKFFIYFILILILVFIYNQTQYFGGAPLSKIIVEQKIDVATITPINIFNDNPIFQEDLTSISQDTSIFIKRWFCLTPMI